MLYYRLNLLNLLYGLVIFRSLNAKNRKINQFDIFISSADVIIGKDKIIARKLEDINYIFVQKNNPINNIKGLIK